MPKNQNEISKKFGVIDLCSGMGGLSFAAREVGLEIWAGIDTSISALSTFRHNFPEANAIHGDVSDKHLLELVFKEIQSKKINKKQLIIISGPPCQGFSVAGPRKTRDPRNEILISVAEAIVHLKAKAALIENVSALQSPRNSSKLSRFKNILNNAGYHVYSFELNAFNFGVPQNRRRVIFYVLPFTIETEKIKQKLRSYYKTPKIVNETLSDLPIPPVRPLNYDPNNENGLIPNHYAMAHSKSVQDKIANIKPGTGPLSYRKLNPNAYAATLLSGHRAAPVHYEQPRSITVREALRLQSFPDCFQVMGPFSKQMEQVTNAVPAPLGKVTLNVLVQLLRGIL